MDGMVIGLVWGGREDRPGNIPNARAVARELRRMGFEVSEGIDLDHGGMKRLIGDFLRGAATARTAVVFYAGHGMQIERRVVVQPTVFCVGEYVIPRLEFFVHDFLPHQRPAPRAFVREGELRALASGYSSSELSPSSSSSSS